MTGGMAFQDTIDIIVFFHESSMHKKSMVQTRLKRTKLINFVLFLMYFRPQGIKGNEDLL